MNLEKDLFLSALYLLPASTWAFVIASLMRISLQSPVTQPSSSLMIVSKSSDNVNIILFTEIFYFISN